MASSSELYASAMLIARECAASNKAYLLCKQQNGNPASCLAEGAGVKSCVDTLIARLQVTCGEPFAKFQKCLADTNNAFDKCAKQKKALNAAFDKLAAK